MKLADLVAKLKTRYGAPAPPATTDPWEMIVWENVVYLANDDVRARAFRELKRSVGSRPADILACPRKKLVAIASGKGILADNCADKLKDAAEIAQEEWNGDLGPISKLPLPKAKNALKKFPGIGDPGAEKILLFARVHPTLPLDSNGLRVLVRTGFGEENKNYSATYQSVRKAVEPELSRDFAWLIQAHQLLRRHGQETCKRSDPLCEDCPLARDCAYYRRPVSHGSSA